LKQAEHAIQTSTDDRAKRVQQANAEILKRRVAAFFDLERSSAPGRRQLQSIENFFGLVNDQVVTLPILKESRPCTSKNSAIRSP